MNVKTDGHQKNNRENKTMIQVKDTKQSTVQNSRKDTKTNEYTPRHIHESTIQKYGINPTFAHLRK